MKIGFVFLILCFLCIRSKAAVFTVANNSSTGAGSLRQAILDANANGNITMDFIYFNIPSSTPGDVTINLTSELPALSPNITIDGTTQSNQLLGSASIKVRLVRASGAFYNGFIIDGVDNIQIYGIYFSNFLSETGVPADERKAGVFLKNASHVIIGAPNKSNGFGGNYTSIISPTSINILEDITISSNIIGLDATGQSPASNFVGIDLSYLRNSTIGGIDASYGNIISTNSNAVSLGGLSGNINVAFNTIGFNINKTTTFPAIQSTGIFANGETVNLTIADNYIAAQFKGIKLDNIKNRYIVRHNVIGTGLNAENYGNTKYGIEVYNCSAGTIGGSNLSDQNVIAYNEQAIQIDFSYPVSILKNSIYCNTKSAIEFKDIPPDKLITQSKIGVITPNFATGTYLPNSIIELFYDDECPDCQGKVWLASIPTNADGTWQYNGPIIGGLTSTGTNADGATSSFSKALINDANKIITDVFCSATNGSITNLSITDASVFKWYNSSNQLVGNDKDLKNVAAGTYYLKAGQPGGCESISVNYTVKNTDLIFKAKMVDIKPASCGNKNGSISILAYETQTPIVFSWTDNAGNEVSRTENLTDVFPGTYTLTASNGNNCTNVVGVFGVGSTELPIINLSKMQQFISCDGKTASTTGIEIIGTTGPYVYDWISAEGSSVYQELNLQGTKPGKYILSITDKFGCSVNTETIDFTQLENKTLQIPNSITPNGDGINDTWKIIGASNYPDAEFYVFNRNGDKIYYSKGYVKDFDGTKNGKPLSVGVYYYMIDLKTDCGKLSGSLTILK
ncbi:gliding motility-associated C-terminal domain-containing protein [Pedobacter aquatilis]|uniref:gliding motility-associated C-terminal domain-containing protein n=1 Tax=Pedobacter aquatilis TaxID=351343 RepID=UPI00292CD19C|nr:gliding motility-associated C-terminal domain-containing protein [Pedobacter aquatilis]